MSSGTSSKISLHRLAKIFLILSLIGIVVSYLHPLHSSVTKIALLGSIGAFWLCALIVFYQYYVYRTIFIVLPIIAIIPFVLPGKDVEPNELRSRYTQALRSYENSTYFWGGENKRGIDCSGLPRRSLRDALVGYGIAHANGKAFRLAAEQWWFDTSAKALGEGYRGFTTNLSLEGNIQSIDTTSLTPGDLAVTKSGIHTLVYLGQGKWIQADPGIGHVATLHGQSDSNTWFEEPVTFHRWKILSAPQK